MLLLLKGEVQLCLATGHFLTLAAGVISTFSEVVQLAKQGTNFLFFFFPSFSFFSLKDGGGLYTDGSDWSEVLWEHTVKLLFMELL